MKIYKTMTQKQKDAITVLNKIKEQWWNTMEGHTNLSEEDYMTILEAIIDNSVTYYPYIPQNPTPQPLEPYYKQWTTTCKKD